MACAEPSVSVSSPVEGRPAPAREPATGVVAPTAKAPNNTAASPAPLVAAAGAAPSALLPPPEPPPRHPFHDPLPPALLPRDAPAMRHANLSPSACRDELAKRELPFKRDRSPAPGIATAFRVDGPLHGVRVIAASKPSPYGKFDCRLALTLDKLAELLAEHEVVAFRADNLYRPRAKLPGRRKPSQHSHGLAIDLTSFQLADGRSLDVERDWRGDRGEPVCGPDATLTEQTDEATRLRNITCAIVRAGLFHHVLTPNYDAAHRDHLHLDIKRDAKRRILR